jgi:hypothetical protein
VGLVALKRSKLRSSRFRQMGLSRPTHQRVTQAVGRSTKHEMQRSMGVTDGVSGILSKDVSQTAN